MSSRPWYDQETPFTLTVAGSQQIRRRLMTLDKPTRDAIRKRIARAGDPVANAVRTMIRAKFGHSKSSAKDKYSGRMLRSVNQTATLNSATVKVNARAKIPKRQFMWWGGKPTRHDWGNRGYRYPRRFEYGDYADSYRFMKPAQDMARPQAMNELERILDDIQTEYLRD